MNEHHDPIAQAAARAVQGVAELRDENARLDQRCVELDKAYCTTMSELEMTKAALVECKRERDFYQRFTIELVTQINNIGQMVHDCMTRARDAAYRPSEAPPAAQTSEPEVRIPQFLAEGPRIAG